MSDDDTTHSIDPRKITIRRSPEEPAVQESDPTFPPTPTSQPETGASVAGASRKRNALTRHSVRDDGSERAARDVEPLPLLAHLAFLGQLFMIYAAPGSGKTMLVLWLIIDAIRLGRVDPESVVYVNADDNRSGADRKAEILAKYGAHTLIPNDRGFRIKDFPDKLRQMIADGSANGMVVIIDTLKKFTNLMDKAETSRIAQLFREFALANGTIIALGHTAKYPKPDGTPRYQGTTDILEDFDAVYVGQPMDGAPGSKERVIALTKEKSRGDSPEKVAYAFSTEEGLAYEEKLDTIRELYPEEVEGRSAEARAAADQDIIASIHGYLASGNGHVGMDYMVRVIAKADGFSREQVRRVLDRYTGQDPARHRWNFTKGAGGKRTFFMLPRAES